MPRYFIQLSYDGTNYHGWQVQENANSVQAEVQRGLSTLLRQTVEIFGAGRTDTAVHARQMFAHFDCDPTIGDLGKTVHQLNSILPVDIAVQGIFEVNDQAHARFDAVSRTYEYHLHHQKDPFLINKGYYFCYDLNMDEMKKAASILTEYDDFTSFSKLHTDVVTNICRIMNSQWETTTAGWKYTIQADRFLRNMVRSIVGTMLEIGKGKYQAEDIRDIIRSKNRSNAGFSVPAHGLYLVEVKYPNHIWKAGNHE